MDLHTQFVTLRASHLGADGDHLDPDGSIRLPFLGHNTQIGQVQWHPDAFSGGLVFGASDMLVGQSLFSLTRVFLFLPSSTKNKPIPLFLFPLFPALPP